MSDERRGFALATAAFAMWGLFPLFWPLLEPAGATEILAHRIFWSLVVTGALLADRPPQPAPWSRSGAGRGCGSR